MTSRNRQKSLRIPSSLNSYDEPSVAGPLTDPYLDGVYHGETGERVSRTRNDNGGEGSDSRVQFRPDRGGTYYIAAEAVGDAIGSYLVMTDAVLFADDCGDDPDNACAIGVGGGRDAWLEHDRDVDWFAVQLTAGRIYRFSIESRDRGNPLTHVRHYSFGTRAYFGGRVRGVYGPDGERLEEGGYYRAEEFTPLVSGNYHFAATGVFGFRWRWTGSGTQLLMELGDYRASVQDVTNSGNDPGDGLADALELAMGGTRLGYIDHFGDRDRFRVELQTGHTYIIEQRSLENLEYPYIRGVYYASGVRISGNADDSGSYKSLGGLVQFTAPEDGTHYVSVSHGGDKWWLPCVCDLGSYQMAIYDVTHIDDYSADTATEGTLRMGQWKQGKVEKAHDKDWYAVDLTTGTRYRILVQDRCSVPWQRSCDDRGTLWYPSLHGIHDSDGTMIPNSGAGSGSGLEESALKAFTTSSDGRYYVSGGGTGTYRAKIENLGARDQTADVNINGHVVVGGYVQGQIDFPGDRDWFAVDLQAGHTYEIDMRGRGRRVLRQPGELDLGAVAGHLRRGWRAGSQYGREHRPKPRTFHHCFHAANGRTLLYFGSGALSSLGPGHLHALHH